MMIDYNNTYPNKTKYYNLTVNETWTYDVPKEVLMVKFAKNITTQRRDYIMNGLRSIVISSYPGNLVIDVSALLSGLTGLDNAFTMIVGIIGIIALIITFFLLLVSTTHNIRDSVWEYGVLRSMGVTKAEGSRIYMYEAFLVVISAGILGCIIGLIVSTLVTVFFNVFME